MAGKIAYHVIYRTKDMPPLLMPLHHAEKEAVLFETCVGPIRNEGARPFQHLPHDHYFRIMCDVGLPGGMPWHILSKEIQAFHSYVPQRFDCVPCSQLTCPVPRKLLVVRGFH